MRLETAQAGTDLRLWVNLKMTIKIKATKQYISVVLFIMLFKVALRFESLMKSSGFPMVLFIMLYNFGVCG